MKVNLSVSTIVSIPLGILLSLSTGCSCEAFPDALHCTPNSGSESTNSGSESTNSGSESTNSGSESTNSGSGSTNSGSSDLGQIRSRGQAPSQAQVSEYEAQVQTQLEAIEGLAGISDYQQTHDNYINFMQGGTTDTLVIPLDQGINYSIVGVCDEDCSDLDFSLYDDNGNEIVVDIETDSFPLVEITPKWDANFTLQVDMYQCDVAPCYYGVGVYGYRPTPRNQAGSIL